MLDIILQDHREVEGALIPGKLVLVVMVAVNLADTALIVML